MKRRGMFVLVGVLSSASVGCGVEPEASSEFSFRCAPGGGAGVVGLVDLKINGNARIFADADASDVFANGNVELMGDIVIEGDAVAGGTVMEMGYAIDVQGEILNGQGTVSVEPPYAEAAAAQSENDNDLIDASFLVAGTLVLKNNESLTLPGGVFYLNGINISGQATLNVEGPTTIYVDGPVSISGGAHTVSNDHGDFNLVSVASDSISFSGNTQAAMNVFAPLAEVKLSGNEQIFGTVLGTTVTVSGFAEITTAGDATDFGKACIPTLPH